MSMNNINNTMLSGLTQTLMAGYTAKNANDYVALNGGNAFSVVPKPNRFWNHTSIDNTRLAFLRAVVDEFILKTGINKEKLDAKTATLDDLNRFAKNNFTDDFNERILRLDDYNRIIFKVPLRKYRIRAVTKGLESLIKSKNETQPKVDYFFKVMTKDSNVQGISKKFESDVIGKELKKLKKSFERMRYSANEFEIPEDTDLKTLSPADLAELKKKSGKTFQDADIDELIQIQNLKKTEISSNEREKQTRKIELTKFKEVFTAILGKGANVFGTDLDMDAIINDILGEKVGEDKKWSGAENAVRTLLKNGLEHARKGKKPLYEGLCAMARGNGKTLAEEIFDSLADNIRKYKEECEEKYKTTHGGNAPKGNEADPLSPPQRKNVRVNEREISRVLAKCLSYVMKDGGNPELTPTEQKSAALLKTIVDPEWENRK